MRAHTHTKPKNGELLFDELTDDCSLGIDSWIALRNCSLKVREEPEYIVFAGENKKPVVEH